MSKEMSLNEKLEKLMDRFEEMDEKINFGREFKTEYDVNWYTDIREAINRLEAIDNANPSEALECSLKLYKMVESAGNGNGFSLNEAWKYHNIIKQSLLKAEQDKKKLNEIEKLTYLLYSKRRKIGQEYIKWCEKNNVVFDDATNMITWVLAIKLKEWLK
jgi:hypothetical protein